MLRKTLKSRNIQSRFILNLYLKFLNELKESLQKLRQCHGSKYRTGMGQKSM